MATPSRALSRGRFATISTCTSRRSGRDTSFFVPSGYDLIIVRRGSDWLPDQSGKVGRLWIGEISRWSHAKDRAEGRYEGAGAAVACILRHDLHGLARR